MNKPTEAPPPFEFTLLHPSGLGSFDIDVIKISAQYTAVNGRDFLSGLAQREQRNPQFDFLKPTHMLFSYFTSLVDAYSKILNTSADMIKNINSKSNKLNALESAVNLWQWNRMEDERKQQASQEADEERNAFQAIDWYDFCVVETIEFREDDLFEAPPLQPYDYGGASKSSFGDDMDLEDDSSPPPLPRSTVGNAGTSFPPPPPRGVSAVYTASDTDMDMDVDMADGGGDDGIEVVADYRPRIASRGGASKESTMIDPISGKAIPVSEMGEHMRLQLMDPKWRIEQQRFQNKQMETSLAEGTAIASSLKQFARHRADIIGSEEEEAQLLIEQNKRQKRADVSNQ